MNSNEFLDCLNLDLGWRKKEISDLYLLAQEKESEVLLKSMILLIYAHWEGFIKKSSKIYLKYISDKNIRIDRLEDNFHAIALKKYFKRFIASRDSFSIDNELQFVESSSQGRKKFKISIDIEDSKESSLINTEHNLKEKILHRIFVITGLSYKPSLQTKKHYIDAHLLANRNNIAHGEPFLEGKYDEFSLSLDDISRLKNIILLIMDSFKEELSDYVSNEYYLSQKKSERRDYEEGREEYLRASFREMGVS